MANNGWHPEEPLMATGAIFSSVFVTPCCCCNLDTPVVAVEAVACRRAGMGSAPTTRSQLLLLPACLSVGTLRRRHTSPPTVPAARLNRNTDLHPDAPTVCRHQ